MHDDRGSDWGRPWDTPQTFIWQLCASWIGTQRNFKINGMTVFDLVHAKVIVTNQIFMQKFSDPLTRKSSEKGMQVFLKFLCIVWVFLTS